DFNPTIVRFKPQNNLDIDMSKYNFNPTIVRFKPPTGASPSHAQPFIYLLPMYQRETSQPLVAYDIYKC
ncbi:MAG: hypothetical protein QW293_07810, partial [Candidatus Nitrosocaldaceae archaeon]